MNHLESLGASERFIALAQAYPSLLLARVVSQSRDLYRIATQQGEALAEVSGRFRFEALSPEAYPAVGDYVMIAPPLGDGSRAIIHHVLPRKSVFLRKAAGATSDAQVVAANIDIAFLCMSLNQNLNTARLERYLAVAWESGATPVVVLTKADLCPEVADVLHQIAPITLGVDVLVTQSDAPATVEAMRTYLKPGITASLMGSSGVGKSTLINLLAGAPLLSTAAIGWEDKGRHTTTHRELIPLPTGGVVIDTPGMRELGVESVDLARSFADIEVLAQGCRFADCTHDREPGCAVHAAIQAGTLEARRLKSYQKLQREAEYETQRARQRDLSKINSMFGSKSAMKQMRDAAKQKNARR